MIKILILDTDKKILAFAQEGDNLNPQKFIKDFRNFTKENKLKIIKLAFSEVMEILK